MTNKDLLVAQGTLLNVMWQPGWQESLGENGYVCVWLSSFVVHLKLSQHCELAILPKENKKLNKTKQNVLKRLF